MQQRRKGFRAKLSAGWFTFDTTTGRWISGPFEHKREAAAECKSLAQQVTAHEGELMADTRKDEEPKDKPADTPETDKAPDVETKTETTTKTSSAPKD